jgi:hypothetical protein
VVLRVRTGVLWVLTGTSQGYSQGYSRVTHRGTHGYPQVLAHAWAGFNATLFAYGQTGSGKTHTMVGDTVGGTESPGREYPVSTDVSTPEYPQCIPDYPCSGRAGATRSDADGVARRAPRVSTPSTDWSTPSTDVSTPSTPSGAGRADGVVPRRRPQSTLREYSEYRREHSEYRCEYFDYPVGRREGGRRRATARRGALQQRRRAARAGARTPGEPEGVLWVLTWAL